MGRVKTHMLDGRTAGGNRIYACGRVGRATAPIRHITRDYLAERAAEVTCPGCQEQYPEHFGFEPTELELEPRDGYPSPRFEAGDDP